MSDEMVIEEGVSPEDIALAKSIASEAKPPETEQVEQPEQTQEQTQEPTQEAESPLTFRVKGEEKEYTKEQLQHLLSREQTFQQKATKLESSDEYKMGLLMAKAKEGDKGARKALLSAIKDMAGDEDLSSFEDTEETFDTEKELEARKEDSKFEEVFADVKSDVDYEETLAKIDTTLKSQMPEKVYQDYYDKPETRRTMYDLVKSGRAEEVFGALNEELQKLPLVDRVKIKNDPELYGSLAYEVIQDLNARKQGATAKDQADSDLDAVSTGTSSRRVEKEEAEPDFLTMSKEEFKAYEKKMLGRVI